MPLRTTWRWLQRTIQQNGRRRVDNRLANHSPAVLLESHGGRLFPAGHRLGAGVPGGVATSIGTRCSAAPTAHGANEAQQEDALDPQQFDALSRTLAHAS